MVMGCRITMMIVQELNREFKLTLMVVNQPHQIQMGMEYWIQRTIVLTRLPENKLTVMVAPKTPTMISTFVWISRACKVVIVSRMEMSAKRLEYPTL